MSMWRVLFGLLLVAGLRAHDPANAAMGPRSQAPRRVKDALARYCDRWRSETGANPTQEEAKRDADLCLRLNDMQVIGTHNSYHVAPRRELMNALNSFVPQVAATLDYTHTDLHTQLANERVRQVELDVYADPKGGRYDLRHALPEVGLPAESGIEVMKRPGFKVLHAQEVDFESTCWTFVACLQQVRAWSLAHPGHVPLAVLIGLKDRSIPDPLGLGFARPKRIKAKELNALDAEIRSVFSEAHLLTPDDVRGKHATLEDAILTDGWPKLADVRGQVMFLMDDGGKKRAAYLDGHPSLEGRVMFTNAEPGDADAAFIKRNDPRGKRGREIRRLVEQGYVVRTMADAETVEAREGDTRRLKAALKSGAQWISTDYPVASRSARFGTRYAAQLPGNRPARCNPVTTPSHCSAALVE